MRSLCIVIILYRKKILLKLPLLKITMKKKKKQKRSKKPGVSLHRLVKITSRSLSKAYGDFKNKQKLTN